MIQTFIHVHFSPSGTASLLERMNRKETTVAIDGSLFKYHPRLKFLMEQYISSMAPGKNVNLIAISYTTIT